MLLEMATSLRVIPATPMTLLALLKAIAYGWQQQAVAANTEEIQRLGQELYVRLGGMVEHLEAVGAKIGQAADGYNRFVGSLEQMVLPSARRFRDLGVSAPKTLGTPALLDLDIRRVRREELTSPGSDSRESDVREAETETPTEFPLLR
jgi:DNA recombination protein RmuC